MFEAFVLKSSSLAELFCWISNGRALLLVFGVPVAIILLFNVGALTLTMISIRKTQKVLLEMLSLLLLLNNSIMSSRFLSRDSRPGRSPSQLSRIEIIES